MKTYIQKFILITVFELMICLIWNGKYKIRRNGMILFLELFLWWLYNYFFLDKTQDPCIHMCEWDKVSKLYFFFIFSALLALRSKVNHSSNHYCFWFLPQINHYTTTAGKHLGIKTNCFDSLSPLLGTVFCYPTVH